MGQCTSIEPNKRRSKSIGHTPKIRYNQTPSLQSINTTKNLHSINENYHNINNHSRYKSPTRRQSAKQYSNNINTSITKQSLHTSASDTSINKLDEKHVNSHKKDKHDTKHNLELQRNTSDQGGRSLYHIDAQLNNDNNNTINNNCLTEPKQSMDRTTTSPSLLAFLHEMNSPSHLSNITDISPNTRVRTINHNHNNNNNNNNSNGLRKISSHHQMSNAGFIQHYQNEYQQNSINNDHSSDNNDIKISM